jgi:hypothetical protein
MATITAQSISDQAVKTLFDETKTRWSETEILGYINDAQRNIVMLKPDAYVKNVSVQMVAGTKQTIPSDGVQLVRVVRNMGSNGTTAGRVVRRTSFSDIDNSRPDWHTETAAAVALNWLYDERDLKNFYLSPPQPATPAYVELVYTAAPPDVAAIGNVITLDDIYKTPIYNYVMARCWAKASEHQNMDRSKDYMSAYFQELGLKDKAESMVDQKAA